LEGPKEKWGQRKSGGANFLAPELGTLALLPTPMQSIYNYALAVHFWCLYNAPLRKDMIHLEWRP